MDSLEHEFEVATATQKIPGTILAAANTNGMCLFDISYLNILLHLTHLINIVTGSFEYLKPFGNISLEKDASPVSASSTMCLASATKLVTCVAAMQCVERGIVKLDEDVSAWLPEWKEAQILKGFDTSNEQKPILEKAQHPIFLKFVG